jgi:hypothetical protein
MANYSINKGIGCNPEFKGLKSQYLFIFAGGLMAVFVLFVIAYTAGVNQWVCIVTAVSAASVMVSLTFRLNAKYGEHGLMKRQAMKNRPRFIINRLRIQRLFPENLKEQKL